MSWFKKNHSVCSDCGVHFEPVEGYEKRWGHLCSTHRKPVQERDEKKDAVISWASANWVKLEKMMEEDNAKLQSDYDILIKRGLAGMESQTAYPGQHVGTSQCGRSVLYGLGSIFQGAPPLPL